MSKSIHVINWRKRTKENIVEAMGGCCQICSYNKTHDALELHHIDASKKEFTFSKIRSNPRAIAEIAKELENCILLCANCHREVHAGIADLPEEYHKVDNYLLIKERNVRDKVMRDKLDRVRVRKIHLTDIEFMSMFETFNLNKSAMAVSIGVSETAIRKRLKKIGLQK